MCQPGFVQSRSPSCRARSSPSPTSRSRADPGLRFRPRSLPARLGRRLPASLHGHDVKLSVGYGYLDTENQSGIPGEDGKQLPFRPREPRDPVGHLDHVSSGRRRSSIWGQWEGEIFSDLANTAGRPHPAVLVLELQASTRSSPRWSSCPAAIRRGGSTGAGVFVQGLNVFDEVLEAAAIAAQQSQFSARASFLGGVVYRF